MDNNPNDYEAALKSIQSFFPDLAGKPPASVAMVIRAILRTCFSSLDTLRSENAALRRENAQLRVVKEKATTLMAAHLSGSKNLNEPLAELVDELKE